MIDRIQFAPGLPQMRIREVGDDASSSCVDYDFPTREDVLAMQVGDRALSPFGELAPIARIIRILDDFEGKAVAHFEVRLSPTSTISMRRREGEITRTIPVTGHHSSNELRLMDQALARLVP